jgi:7,8-dihydro-6-hydroxymethylpterin dimethyltransferase
VDQIGEIIRFGLKHSPVVRGVHFQSVSYLGRHPAAPVDPVRITIPEILRAIELQSDCGHHRGAETGLLHGIGPVGDH